MSKRKGQTKRLPEHRGLGLPHQRAGELFNGFWVQLRNRADLQEFAACILILDGLQKSSVVKDTSGPPSVPRHLVPSLIYKYWRARPTISGGRVMPASALRPHCVVPDNFLPCQVMEQAQLVVPNDFQLQGAGSLSEGWEWKLCLLYLTTTRI